MYRSNKGLKEKLKKDVTKKEDSKMLRFSSSSSSNVANSFQNKQGNSNLVAHNKKTKTLKIESSCMDIARVVISDNPPNGVIKEFEELPMLSEVRLSERESILIRKIKSCQYIFDFNIISSNYVRLREIKRNRLIEISDYMMSNKNIGNDIYKAFFNMFCVNVFRDLVPFNPIGAQFDPEEDEPVLEPAWPHIIIIYELFLKIIECPEFSSSEAKKHIDSRFLIKLLNFFQSEDPREREQLKTIMHRIYGKYLGFRSQIRRLINNVIYRFVYETEHHNGISEILEILGSIINGFSIPIKDEHKVFFKHVLLPLHKAKSIALYHPQLVYCCLQFVEKECNMVQPLIAALLKYWPKLNSTKELQFLNEIEEILDIIDTHEMTIVAPDVFKQISKCIQSEHFQIVERALYLWNNEVIISHISSNVKIILPIVYPALQQYPKDNWNKTSNGLIYNALKIFMEINQTFFDKCVIEYNKNLQSERKKFENKINAWNQIEKLAQANPMYNHVKDQIKHRHQENVHNVALHKITYTNKSTHIPIIVKPSDVLAKESPIADEYMSNGAMLRRKSQLPSNIISNRDSNEKNGNY